MEAQESDSWVGRTLGGRYLIHEVIGEGGMGVVYRAQQLSIDREVAIKMMHTRAAQDPQWSERFQSEAKACSLLTHPNTIRLYDFGKTTLGNYYMVMELLNGQSLTETIESQSPMAPARVLRILMQCCASLSEAHKAGIIHRDIKPDNIIVQKLEGADDFIKLIDFSIAKRSDVAMTAAGMIMGTPQFMSPEQGRGEGIDLRSDLYSLGIVAYYMLAGRLPFHHEDAIEVLRMHQSMEVPPMPESIPSSVSMLIMSCLDKNKARRPASALALLEASKIWLTELDPTLDVASDPILKNTLMTGGPTVEMEATTNQPVAPTTPASSVKTMLGASGAIGASWSRSRPPGAEPAALMRQGEDAKRTVVRDVSGLAASTSNAMAEAKQTLVRDIQPGGAPAIASQDALSDSKRTLLRDSRRGDANEARRTAIQSPSGPQRSDSEEMRLAEDHRERRPTNQPTLNEFSPAPRASGANAYPVQSAPSPHPAPVGAGQAPFVSPVQNAVIAPLGHSSQFPAAPAQSSSASFLLACLLVALTFGFGAYFLTSTLR